jgi:hypothetical protein
VTQPQVFANLKVLFAASKADAPEIFRDDASVMIEPLPHGQAIRRTNTRRETPFANLATAMQKMADSLAQETTSPAVDTNGRDVIWRGTHKLFATPACLRNR